MLDIMVRMYGTPSITHLAKFWAKQPESSQPIRLLDFQNAVTSKLFDRF